MSEELMVLPAVPLRDLVMYPHINMNLDMGRPDSRAAVEKAAAGDRYLVTVLQKDPDMEDPTPQDLCEIATVVKIKQVLNLPGNVTRISAEGISRVRCHTIESRDGMFIATVSDVEETHGDLKVEEAYRQAILDQFFRYLQASHRNVPPELAEQLRTVIAPGQIADFVGSQLPYSPVWRQEILETFSIQKRLEKVKDHVDTSLEIAELVLRLNDGAKKRLSDEQKKYFLRKRIEEIRDELGEGESIEDEELDEYRKKLVETPLSEEAREKAAKEISRLETIPTSNSESSVIRTYLDWIFDMPWGKETKDNIDLRAAKKMLDEDHFGLDKVKDRILEYLAVKILAPNAKGNILCFVGPPGVGKTSLAKSIARAMGRNFARISLGGVTDEAEIRGHRRTYIASMPGRFITAMSEAKSMNPLILLDELDKIGTDFRGDPASALLEALDPEQNKTFKDHYLDMEFDLSHVFFLCTANTTQTIPPALLDRMEIISLSGYTEEEKLEIAKRYLVPKERKASGLSGGDIRFSKALLEILIRNYTREAGVRELERLIGSLCRKTAKHVILMDEDVPLSAKTVESYLGPYKYIRSADLHPSTVGRVNGLAWTQVGGEVLDVEAVALKGSGKLELTGQLGDVMKESAQAAYTYIRSRAGELGLADNFYEKSDMHIHLPEGAIPKDGPSAGITMATAMASAFTGRKVRSDYAMTGEINLTGDVLPIGGLKEKSLAAAQLGIENILIPEQNVRDLEEIPETVKQSVHFIPVKHMDEVLARVLED